MCTVAINPPNFGLLNQQAGQIAIDFRDGCQRVINFNNYLQNLGKPALITLGFTSADADLLLAIYGNLSAVAMVCEGGNYTGPGLPFDFIAQTIPVWGGG